MMENEKLLRVTAAIIKKDNKIFIARRAQHKHLAGFWEFPGGKIENNETPEVCLKRELIEELGITVTVGKLFMENQHDYGDKIIMLMAYLCELISGDISLKDHDKFAWVEKTELTNFKFAPADIPFVNALHAEQEVQ